MKPIDCAPVASSPETSLSPRNILSEAMAEDDDQPATKGDVRRLGEELRAELATKAELRSEIDKAVMGLMQEMARQANIIIEQIGAKIGVVDEKYQDLPPRFEAHTQDFVLHNRPPAPRVAKKPKSPKKK
jgi:hypothetical protein